MKNKSFLEKLTLLFKSKIGCIGITTTEEVRVIPDIIKAYRDAYSEEVTANYIFGWEYSQTKGLRRLDLENNYSYLTEENDVTKSDGKMLSFLDNFQEEYGFIICKELRSLQEFSTTRMIRDIKELNTKQNYCPLIIVAPIIQLTPSIQKLFKVINYDTPDDTMITNIVNKTINKYKLSNINTEKTNEIVSAARGLTASEVITAMRISIEDTGTIDSKAILDEKIQIIHKSGILSYKEPSLELDDIGGHNILKKWVVDAKKCMTKEAAKFGVERAKGFIATGLAGSGKTAIAEAIAKYFNMPLVIFDLSKIMGGIVGESERQATQAFNIIDSLRGCVILVDEAEKLLGGVSSSNRSDGGTMARVFSIFLNRMNANTRDFYIFTSNDMSALPPELTRSGRLDTKWFFNYPSLEERKEIFNIHFKKRNHPNVSEKAIDYCADMTEYYTGAEIEQSVKNILKNVYIRSLEDKSIIFTKADISTGVKEVSTIFDNNPAVVNKMINSAKINGIKPTSNGGTFQSNDIPEWGFALVK